MTMDFLLELAQFCAYRQTIFGMITFTG